MYMNNEIVVIYKEVGKEAEFKKVKNDFEVFEALIGGELDYIPYEEIIIIARKNRKNLRANIYINTKFLSVGESIRGNIVIVCKENEKLKSLSKEQAIKYRKFLKQANFNYDNFDETDRLIQKKHSNNRGQLIMEREIGDADISTKNDNLQTNIETSETLKMILGIQAVILKFIKNNGN